MREIIKIVLEELSKDGLIDSTLCQGSDFEKLVKRIESRAGKKFDGIIRENKANNHQYITVPKDSKMVTGSKVEVKGK